MKTIDVCVSPELMHLYDVSDRTVVVVDILRATSCMVTAFAHGVQSITPFANAVTMHEVARNISTTTTVRSLTS